MRKTRRVVTAAILRREGKILLARRKDGVHPGSWEFPGGKVESGETEEQCLARELREELGIETTVGRLIAESIFPYDHGEIHLKAYETEWITGELQPTVHDQVLWVAPHELTQYDLLPADVPIAVALGGR